MAAFVAITDVAVEMGPRNRRRLTVGVIGLVAVAVLAVGLVRLTRSASNPGAGSTAHAGRSAANTSNLTFGMSIKQVERLAGRPVKTETTAQGRCLFYRPKGSMVGSLALAEVGSLAYGKEIGFEACFYGSGLSTMFVHHPRPLGKPGFEWSAFYGNPYYSR
ncbi:MAG TPA: hypothetical protein VFA97_08590 [Gaiellaceae bacterium]|nr:hypothetical protein [Gaiellaceae bacterium]